MSAYSALVTNQTYVETRDSRIQQQGEKHIILYVTATKDKA